MSTEFERIDRWLMPLSQPAANPPVLLGNGDDALAVKTDRVMVMSIDTAVSGTHFPAQAAAKDVATKTLRAALSDLAAMGARPWFYTLSLVVPRQLSEHWWAEFSQALVHENHHWRLPCLGGDTTAGELLVVTIQVHGLCEHPLTRSAAQPDDDVWVTNTLGSSAGGLRCVLADRKPGSLTSDQQTLVDAFYRPSLPLGLMASLAPTVHAAIDVSDGLLADLGHVLKASHCGAQLALEKLPVAAALVAEMGAEAALELALTGGEDFATCFTAPRGQREYILAQALHHQTPVTRIGRITAEPGCRLTLGGLAYARPDMADHAAEQTPEKTLKQNPPNNKKGYDHFG